MSAPARRAPHDLDDLDDLDVIVVGGGELLGATIVAPTAGELVGEVALAMRTRMFTGRLAQTIHAYPTWSMAIQQAATQFFFATDGVEARPARSAPSRD